MLNLFQGGDPAAGPADDLRVVTLLDRGVQEARSLDAEPAVQAELYETLGGIYQKMGKLEQADSLMESALAKREALTVRIAPRPRRVYWRWARCATQRQGMAMPSADSAGAGSRQAPVAGQRSGGGEGYAGARWSAGRSRCVRSIDRNSGQTVQLYSAPGAEPVELADSLYELANAHFYAGHYEKSEEINERALAMYKQIYGERHPRVAEILINLGAIQLDTGHYAAAEQYDRQALDIVQAWYGKDNPETATDLTILARSLVYQKRYAEASDLLQQSLVIKERTFGRCTLPSHPRSTSLGIRGAAGRQVRCGRQYFTRMADIYRTEYGSSTTYMPRRFPIWPACTRRSSSGLAPKNSTARRFPFYVEIAIAHAHQYWHRANQTGENSVAPTSGMAMLR